jgi:hypothetical protein
MKTWSIIGAATWATLIVLYADRVYKYGWSWIWQPFVH